MLCIVLCTNKNHYIFYCSLLKSTDLIILENALEYFATKSLLVVDQVPSLCVRNAVYFSTAVLMFRGMCVD